MSDCVVQIKVIEDEIANLSVGEVNLLYAKYTGVDTDSIDMTVNNANNTISAELTNEYKAKFNTYVYTQNDLSDTWVITHNLNKYPSVSIVDQNKNVVYSEIVYDNQNQITIYFNNPLIGFVYLN